MRESEKKKKNKRPKGYNGKGVLRGFNAITSHVSFHLYDKAEKLGHKLVSLTLIKKIKRKIIKRYFDNHSSHFERKKIKH